MISGNYTYTTKAAGTTDEAGVAAAHGLRLMGYSISERANAVATVDICHGAAAGTIVHYENFAALQSVSRWFGPQGIPVPNGVWLERVSGNTAAVFITTIDT
jgi:hypothetical protein